MVTDWKTQETEGLTLPYFKAYYKIILMEWLWHCCKNQWKSYKILGVWAAVTTFAMQYPKYGINVLIYNILYAKHITMLGICSTFPSLNIFEFSKFPAVHYVYN